ncbi:MAG TPA: DmsC/YnfH family molybdoenzyme membrane anchor subunit [Polyangiaceae bacterium]|jgi:Fe-S-cluster-containing dehydrogenase component/DMSO reductase anchor subunit|nr:DmsC/YnfH family molybdoenzyme membrane anchor subunit [Polyangiaceae bacterium]
MVADASALFPRPAARRREPVRLPLVQHYLREQQKLSAVERFSQRHEAEALAPGARYYRDLLPLEKPGPGQQLAFEVDLDACSGCKACVTACHRLNGLDDDEGETWRSVGLLHGGSPEQPVQQTVTTACHHCVDPACMKGCPVGAYEKDPVTGIVKHLDDQCIGCQYCTLTCPYEVPQYSKKRGIVRKCDMCSDRLAEGEPPACVQACPNEAISIRIVETKRVLEDAQGEAFLPGAPSPTITVPTTTYKSRRPLPRNVLPADFHRVRSAHRHTPLVVLLVLTQLSVGAFVADLVLGKLGGYATLGVARPYQSLLALAMGLLALGASVFHLGRPQYAFRAVLGIRTSWMSRECAAFGLFAGSAVAYASLFWVEPLVTRFGLPAPPAALLESGRSALGYVVAGSGLIGVLCSMMLYKVTARRWWSAARTSGRFLLTAAVLGISTTNVALTLAALLEGRDSAVRSTAFGLFQPLALLTVLKLALDAEIFLHLKDRGLGELRRTALLLVGELRPYAFARFAFGAAAVALLLGVATNPGIEGESQLGCSLAAWALLLLGEFFERTLFFSAQSAPKMPGAVGP